MDIETVLLYLNSLASEEMTLERVAGHFHYNPAYLSRKFKETTGVSFRKYVESLKIQRGKLNILEQQGTITEVSQESGFEFSNNFATSFKKHTGLNPKSYRKASSRAYGFLKRFLTRVGSYTFYKKPDKTRNRLLVDLDFPEGYDPGINFVGIFPEPLPNGLPIVGVATRHIRGIRLDNIPNGSFYLLACDIDHNITFFRAFAMEDNFRGKAEGVFEFTGDSRYELTLPMRLPLPGDPAITINLPKMLMDLMERK